LILESLSLQDTQLKVATLELIKFILLEAPNVFSVHISSAISLLLSGAKRLPGNDVYIRTKSIEILGLLPKKIDVKILASFKPTIIRSLEECLDDHKLAVRWESAATRNIWFLTEFD
jgi:hypothetical protein